MFQIRPAATLDGGDFGWLNARHHFKVTPAGNPVNRPMGSLQGVVRVNGQRLVVGDGIAASDEPTVIVKADVDAEIVMVATN
jgi:hypothetical protein